MCQRFLACRAAMPGTYESENIDNQLLRDDEMEEQSRIEVESVSSGGPGT